MTIKTAPEQGEKICPQCEKSMPAWRSLCEDCAMKEFRGKSETSTGSLSRPGCVTVYGYFLIGVAVLYFVFSLIGLFSGRSTMDMITLFIWVAIGGFTALMGYSLLHQAIWAWWVVVILQGLGLLSGLYFLFSGDFRGFMGALVSGFIFYWFLKNKKYFY